MTDLLPCPFCGGRGRLHQNPTAQALWRVTCDNCDAGPHGSFGEFGAARLWNTRSVMPDLPQRSSEQLRSSGPAEQNPSSRTWTAGIDAMRSYPFQDTQWHLHAIEFHHKVREEAEGLRDRWLALALSRPEQS